MDEAQAFAALENLRQHWFVELTSTDTGWCLQLIKRVGGYGECTFKGPLGDIVARAARGDRPDFYSR